MTTRKKQKTLLDAFTNLLGAMAIEYAERQKATADADAANEAIGADDLLPLAAEFYRHPIRQHEMDKRITAAMLRFNTGSHFLDSGGAYGRNWEHNAGRQFDNEPQAHFHVSFWGQNRKHEKPSWDFEFTRELYAWIVEHFAFEPALSALFHEVYVPEKDAEDDDNNWLGLAEEFPAWLQKNGFEMADGEMGGTDNSYNSENNLSQVIQSTIFEIAVTPDKFTKGIQDGAYVLISVHGGCDVRGGYAAPMVFSFSDGEAYMPSYDTGTLFCNTCHNAWDMEPGGRDYDRVDGQSEVDAPALGEYRIVEDAEWPFNYYIKFFVPFWAWVIWYCILHPKQVWQGRKQKPLQRMERFLDDNKRIKFWPRIVGRMRWVTCWWDIKEVTYTREQKHIILDRWARILKAYSQLLYIIWWWVYLPNDKFHPVNFPLQLRGKVLGFCNRMGIADFWNRYLYWSALNVAKFLLDWYADMPMNQVPPRRYSYKIGEKTWTDNRWQRLSNRRYRIDRAKQKLSATLSAFTRKRNERESLYLRPTDSRWSVSSPQYDAAGRFYIFHMETDAFKVDFPFRPNKRRDEFEGEFLNGQFKLEVYTQVFGQSHIYRDNISSVSLTLPFKSKLKFKTSFINPVTTRLNKAIEKYRDVRYWFAVDDDPNPTCPACREGHLEAGI